MNAEHTHTKDTEYTDRWALHSGLTTHTLPNNWFVRPVDTFRQGFYLSDEPDWLPTTVPGHWQQHPDLTYHSGKAVYRCHFAAPPPPDHQTTPPQQHRTWLRLNGAFYYSEPYLNGTSLGRREGYFAPTDYDVTDLLRDDNTLIVEVECPDEPDKFNKRLITGVFSHWDCFDPLANPGGIWLPVELQQSGPVRLHNVRCHSDSFHASFAQLRYTADLHAQAAGPVTLRWTFQPRTFDGPPQVIEQRRVVRSGTQTINGLLKLRDPRLWWTHNLGRPDLYTFTLEVLHHGHLSDRLSFVFGVRRFELRNWIPHLNGVRLLIKGSNYAPGDMRIATMNLERCRHDIRLARECHMNLLRVHAHVDHPALYHAANEAGILLWQDMPLQWLYHPDVLPEARRQARAMVHLLYNHPAIAIWCMHNEPVFVADTADESVSTRLRTYGSTFGFSWNRDVLDTQIKQLAEDEDPQRPVIRSSGEFYVPYLMTKTGTDTHAYFGWYSSYGTLAQAEAMRRRFPSNMRFMTEFGAQSFPNLESAHKFMPADIAEIDFEHLEARHGFQGGVMGKWLPWQQASSLAELIEMTQNYQIFINRYYIDRLRYHKYRPTGGIVPFSFLDPYPAVLWSVVDYWRVPKRSYYAMQMAFSPQYAFAVFDPRTYQVAEPINLPIYVVNDDHRPIHDVHLRAWLTTPTGEEVARVQHDLTLDADCLTREVDRLRLTPRQRGTYRLHIQLTGVAHIIEHSYEIEVA